MQTREQKKTVAIVGAGGKMGMRAAEKLGSQSRYHVLLCEKDKARAELLSEDGFTTVDLDAALKDADFVVLAVPDEAIGVISHASVPKMKPGSTLIMLDAAAAYAGQLPSREGITQMITHPCHPAIFSEQTTHDGRRDYFGGTAVQDIIVSLVEGSESAFAEGTELSTAIFAPVGKFHRVTPEQFALLEPAMAEIVVACAATLIKDSLDLVIEKGVPAEAASAFMAGHAQIALAIVLGAEKSPFSDAAKIAIKWGREKVIRSDWKQVFERDDLQLAIQTMLHPGQGSL